MLTVGVASLIPSRLSPIVNSPAGMSTMPGGGVAIWLDGMVPVTALAGMFVSPAPFPWMIPEELMLLKWNSFAVNSMRSSTTFSPMDT